MRLDHLVRSGKVQPYLEQLHRVGRRLTDQREHLGVHDPATGSHPLHVAGTEPGCSTHRVGVIDETLSRVRDRLEATMRMLRKARHRGAVVHPPAVPAFEVRADVAPGQRRSRAEPTVARRICVVVMHTKQKRINGRPLESQRDRLQNRRCHTPIVRSDNKDCARKYSAQDTSGSDAGGPTAPIAPK